MKVTRYDNGAILTEHDNGCWKYEIPVEAPGLKRDTPYFEPGEYEVWTMNGVKRIFLKQDDDGWFNMSYGKLKASSAQCRRVNNIVKHGTVVDWEATFRFMKKEVYEAIDNVFENAKKPKPKRQYW